MNIFKTIFLITSLSMFLNAMMIDDIVYVQDEDASKISLKDEFLKEDTKYYTLTVATLKNPNFDMIDFFKAYNLTNAIAYKYGENKQYIKVISGLYKTGTQAQNDIKNLHINLQNNQPYSSKLFRHQDKFAKFSKIKKTQNLVEKKVAKRKLIKEANSSIFIANTNSAKALKDEFLNNSSKYYSIAVGTIDLNRNTIKNFYDAYGIEDNSLAHLYGKNKDKVRVIYGLYKSRKEALEAITNFNENIKSNSPYPMQMKKFQSFYSKSFPNELEKKDIVPLMVNDKKVLEKSVKAKISDELKIVEVKKPKKEDIKRDFSKKTQEPKKKIEKPKKIEPKKVQKSKAIQKPKKLVKRAKKYDPNKHRFVKKSSLENVYFLESAGSFNILNEVFLNDGSSFYTVDLGELDLSKTSIEEFFLSNAMQDDALAYKYGANKEFARVVYGAFETKEAAQNKASELKVNVKNLRVSNIKNHQKLYKEFHKEQKVKKNERTKNKVISKNSLEADILFTSSKLKDEFLNKGSVTYTITLITFLKDEVNLEEFLIKNNLKEDTLAYSLGSANNYYRVLYGNFSSFNEAKKEIENLSYELKANSPYVSRIRTQQRKFESYNDREIKNQVVQKLDIEK